VHGADASGRALLRKKVSRAKLLPFFAAQPPCQVVLEACGGAHHWARELTKLGHDVRLIAPAYVKPFVKRQKNDAADAEAICEAAQRPSMRFVPVKTEAQQAAALVFRARDLLVKQRTQISNAIRGHMTEHGWIAPRGLAHMKKLAALLEDPEAVPVRELPYGPAAQKTAPGGRTDGSIRLRAKSLKIPLASEGASTDGKRTSQFSGDLKKCLS
jgi:transposase